MRRNQDAHVRLGYSWELEEEYAGIPPECYELQLWATVSPYDPGDRDCPPSGPTVEIDRVSLESVITDDGTHSALSEPRRHEIEAAFEKWIEDPAQVYVLKELENRFCYEAYEADLAAKEDAEERRLEMRRERELL